MASGMAVSFVGEKVESETFKRRVRGEPGMLDRQGHSPRLDLDVVSASSKESVERGSGFVVIQFQSRSRSTA
jgi:hypothetical protein